MSNFDARAYMKKLRSQEKEENESSSKGGFDALSAMKKVRYEKEINFDTFQSDLSSMGKTIGDIYGGWQSQETMNNTRSSVESMQNRINAYQKYRKLYGNDDAPDLSELATSYGEVLGNWDERAKTYGKYKDADSYTKEKTKLGELYSMTSADVKPYLNDKKNTVAYTTADGYNILWKDLYNDAYLKEYTEEAKKNPNFEKTKGYKKKDVKYSTTWNGYSIVDDEFAHLYNYINGDEEAKNHEELLNINMYGTSDSKKNAFYTNEEKAVFNSIAETQGEDKALEYAKFLDSELRQRRVDYEKDFYTNAALEDPVGASVVSVIDNLGNNMMALPYMAIDYAEDGNIDEDSSLYTGRRRVQTERGTVEGMIDSDVGQFFYRHGMNTADNVAAMAMSGFGKFGGLSKVIQTGIMSSGAVVDTAIDAKSRGLSDEQALGLGAVAGAAEYFFESKGYDALFNTKNLTRSGWKYFAQNLVTEEIGELSTELTNDVADILISQDLSKWQQDINSYVASGMTEKEAFNKAFKEAGLRYADVAAGTLFSTGVISGTPAVVGSYKQRAINNELGQGIRESGQVGDILDIASNPEVASAYEAYTRYSNKGITADNITDAQLGRLYTNAELDAQETLSQKKVKPAQAISAMDTMNKLNNVKNRVTESKQIAERVAEMHTGEVTEETSTGNSFTIEGIKVGKEDTTLVTSEGEISLNDVTLSQNDAELVAYAEGMDEKLANLFITQYDGQTKLSDYASSFNLVSDYARLNYTQDAILDHKGVLTEKQVGAIYAETVKATFEEQQNAVNKLSEKYGASLSIQGRFDDSVIDRTNKTTDGSKVNWKDLTSSQRKAVTFAKLFSKATGVNIKFIKSKVEKGEHQGENGSYNPKTNTIEIDVFAGRIDAKAINDSIIPTLSHEITHWAKYKAPAIYNALREEVMKTLSDNSDWTTSERVVAEMNRLKEKHSDMEVTPEDAIDEIVARACEDMLSNSNAARRLLAKMSVSEQQDFISKVKETFNNLMQWVNELLSHYKSDTEEAKILREYKHNLKKISKMWDNMLVSAVETNQALQKEGITGEELVNGISKDGTTIIGKNNIQMSERTYAEGGRDFLKNWLEEQDLSADDKKNILEQTDAIAKLMKDIRENNELPEYARWATMDVAKDENGEKILSVIVKNGDYAMNIDFSQVCKKRVALNAVLNAMVQSGDLNAYTLTETDVAELNAIIKKHEFEIACALCFVDSKRYRVGSWAESFCEGANKKKNGKMVHQHGFNEMVRSLIPKGSNIKVDEFNFTNREIVGQPTENLLSEMDDSELDFTLIDEILEREYNEGKKPTDLYAYAKAIKDNKDLRKILNPAEIISSIGLDAIRLEKPELYRLINRHQGTAKPKFAHDVVAYTNDVLKASKFTKEKAKMVGGVRCQSFSDFMANMVFDYVQFISELSAKELTAHSYTKEPLFVKLFGLTGMKINMSLVPKAIQMTPEQQEYFAILNDPNANKRSAEYRQAKRDYNKLTENAGLDENGNYIWEDETFPYDIAMELVVDPRYSANCGTIAVGISDNHILKLLADDRISMVIPYHKSGLNHIVAMMRNIDLYNDYTKTQNTRFANGKKLEGVPDFNFYEDLYGTDAKEGTHDPKKTAENYLKWCDEHNYIPKFEKSRLDRKFRDNPNYYKLLIDFRVYDTDGTYREQQAVKPIYPSNKEFKDLILNGVVGKDGTVYGGLKQQQGVSDKLNKESQQIIDEYRERMKEKHGKDVFAKKHSDRQVIDIPFNTYETMEGHFGTTKNYDVAGYLLRDGKMLDFSGKHWGGGASTSRQVDHRDIQEVLEDSDNGVTAMMSMISNGNIRLMPEVGGINLSAMPNGFQLSVLRGYINHFKGEVIVDIDAYGGDTIHSFEYSRGTSADKILSDLEGYFRRGEIPTRTKSELADFHMQYSDRNYSYNELIAKDDLKGIVIDKNQQVKLTANGSIDAGWIVTEVKKKCEKLTTESKTTVYYSNVPDIGRNVEISNKGITHAFFKSVGNTKKASQRDLINARVSLEIPQILQNSIEVNRSARNDNVDVPYSHIMMGTVALEDANGNLEYYAVRSVIEERVNQNPILAEAEVLGRLYAINAKKVGTPNAQVTKNGVALTYDVAYTYNIAQFLEDVKVVFDDTFSEDVYKTLGMTRKENEFSEHLLFSDRPTQTIYDKMGETERLAKENELLKADLDRLQERLKLEGTVTKGDRYDKRKLGLIAGHLRNIAKSTTSNETLVPMLEEAFGYMARLDDPDSYNGTMRRLNQIADALLQEAKPETVSDAYAKLILRDIRGKGIKLTETQVQEAKRLYGENYRNAFWGKVIIAKDGISLDSKWQDWASKYPAYFDANVTEGDQVGALLDIYNGLRDLSEMLVEYDRAEVTRWLAQEVLNQFWNLKPITTIADKYEKRIKELNFEHRKRMAELRDDYADRMKKEKAEIRQKTAERLKELRDRKDAEIAEVKKLSKERMDKYKENAERKTVIQRITGNALTLNKWLTKNSKDYHIHKAMQGPVVKLLQAIDFSSKRMLEKGDPTQKDVSFGEAFAEVRAMLADADNMVEGLEALYGHDLAEDIKKLVETSYRLVGDNNFVLNAMSNEELQSLDKLVRHIKKVVSELNKFHTIHHNQGAVNLANEFMEHGERIGTLKKQHGKIGKSLEFRNKTPYYFFKHLGEAGKKVFEAFQDGWDKLSFNAKKIIDFAEETYTAKEVKEWSKETKEFTIGQTHGGDRTFEMSIAQIMALHCVSKQEDAKTHLLSGGMTLKRLDKKGHVVADYENINLSITDIQSILETLTDRQREVADKLQEFMNTVCSAWGNEISMARFGVEMFGLPDYFPIKVSEATVPTDNTKDIDNASLFRLLNMSFTKSRNQYADQSIEIGDIFDIFAQHSSDMAKYNALALPVLDFNKFYSIHGKDALNKEYGVEKTLKSAFGDEANGYLRRFVRDLNGSQNVSRDVIGNTFFKNAKLASVAANFRVVLLQPTAFYKASAVMDNKYLLKASAYMKYEPIMMYNRFKKAVDKAEKYCGIVQWKALGYYDTDISKGLTEKIKHADTFKDKVTELSMKGAEIADKATFATLWTACEFEIRDTRKELKVGSKEYYDAVGKRLREVIYATQVVDSTMTRSDMMRSTDGFDKLKTTFGSEPIIAYNMLLDMVTQYTLDKKEFGKKESKKRNGKKIRKVVTAYVITNVMAALVESGFDWLRDDDDEEMDMVEFMKTYLKNFAFDMSIGNKLPFIKEFYSALQGYSSSRMDTQWLQYLQYALNSKKPVTVLNNLLKVFSQMSGYAFYNAYRDIMATLNKLDIFTTEDLEEFFDGFLD